MHHIGILGLDTSHGEAFAEQLSAHPATTLSHVWDSGTIRDKEYVDAFCDHHECVRVSKPMDLLDQVDAVMVLTLDWNQHASLARPFLAAGLPVMIDKPLAGSIAQVRTISNALQSGEARLFGGSVLPFAPPMQSLSVGSPGRRIVLAGYDDPFYYGAHLTDLTSYLIDSPWTRVEPRAGSRKEVSAHFENDANATLILDGPTDTPGFGVLDVADRTKTVFLPAGEGAFDPAYRQYVGAFVDVIEGTQKYATRVCDAARLLVATVVAHEETRVVHRGEEALETYEVDSEAFIAGYEPYY